MKDVDNVAEWSSRRWSFIALSIFFVLALTGLRQILGMPGTVGHHWDWSLPSSSLFYAAMLSQSSQVWNSQLLGHPFGYGISVLPSMALIGFLGSSGVSGEILSKTLLLAVISFSGFSSYQLLLQISKTLKFKGVHPTSPTIIQTSSILGGYFYASSPFLFNEIIGGAYTQFVAYSLAPLAILTFILARANGPGNRKYIVASALTLSALAMSLQYLVLVVVIMIIISLPAMRNGLSWLAKILLLWLPLNLYWIFPLSYSLDSTLTEATTQNSSASIFQNFQTHVPNVVQAFVGTGYWTDFFTSTIPSWFLPVWFIASLSLVSSALIFLVAKRSLSNAIPWVILLLLSIGFETGSNSPLWGIVQWMVANLPPMLLFKSPQHLIFPAILALSVLIGIFAVSLIRTLPTARRIGIFLALLVLVSVWISPFLYGNLGGYVDPYRLSPGYQKINEIIARDTETGFRVLYLPSAGSPQYLVNQYQSSNQGGDPMVIYSPGSALASDIAPNQQAKDLASGIEGLLAQGSPPINASKMLAFLNVKYIILRSDVVPNFGPLAGRWNSSLVAWNLRHLDGLMLVGSFPEAMLWRVELARTPLIYAATNVIYDDLPILGIRNWQVLHGEWTAYQRLAVNGTAGILATSQVYDNFQLQVKTNLMGDKSSLDNWVLWRGTDANNYYYAGQTGVGYFTVGVVQGGHRTELYSVWMSYTRGQPVWIKILANGQESQVYSGDGTDWKMQYIVTDSAFRTGFVGLYPTGGGQFGNVTINDAKGNLLFKDAFDDSNLVQLVLSPRFTIGQTLVVSSIDYNLAQTKSNSTAQADAVGLSRFEIKLNSPNPFYLVYSESFDPGWTLGLTGAKHLLGNGFANVWEISSPGTHQASLTFEPQVLFEYGTIVTLGTLVASTVLLTDAHRFLKSAIYGAKRRFVDPRETQDLQREAEK